LPFGVEVGEEQEVTIIKQKAEIKKQEKSMIFLFIRFQPEI